MTDLFYYAGSDSEWSKEVRLHYHGYCAWPGCTNRWGMGAHHIIRRGRPEFRRLVANGLYLCDKHHRLVEEYKGREQYDTWMRLLAGAKRYDRLKQMETDSLDDISGRGVEIDMPSSEIGW